jgi:hypothetical protein
MKKDIEIPIASGIAIVATKEWDKAFKEKNWNVYLINNRDEAIETVLVMSRGNKGTVKTSVLRHGLGDLPAHTGAKVELISESVFGFVNEYLVTFFLEGVLYEKTFVFRPHSISEKNAVFVDLMGQDCVLAE